MSQKVIYLLSKTTQNAKYKFDLDLCPFDLKFNRGSRQVMGNTSVKYHHFIKFMSNGNRVIVKKRRTVQI